jgi:hypothetical protein
MEQGISTLTPAMITTWTLVALAVFALGSVVYVAIRNRTRTVNVEKALEAFRSLDIEAFRNLVDSSEEAFLRDNLSPRKFREIKRQRTWAALLYAVEAGKAAAALAQVGQAAQRSSDPKMAATGVQIAENAFRLRLLTIGASLRLIAETLVPTMPSRSHPPLVDQYHRAAETLLHLGRFSPGRHGVKTF